jgi:hypothetical protein
MPLVDVPLSVTPVAIPREVRRFLHEADRRIDDFQALGRVTGFVPGNYEGAYQFLRALGESPLARGREFCEWGSGFGVVAALAAILEFDAYGIEIVGDLVIAARRLADDFELPVEFVHGSFVPPGSEARIHASGSYSWLETEGDSAYEELGLDPDDFDVVFAYPWPDEEAVTADLFDRYAGDGALLVTFHGENDFRIRRKVAGRRRR